MHFELLDTHTHIHTHTILLSVSLDTQIHEGSFLSVPVLVLLLAINYPGLDFFSFQLT